MMFCERAGYFRERGGNLVGLGRQNQDVGKCHDRSVGRDRFGAGFGGEIVSRGGVRIAGHDFPGHNEFGADKTFRQRGGHFARAEKADV